MATAPIQSIKVFYSYADEDESLQKELEKHLSNLRQQGFIAEWHKRRIVAGTDWMDAMNSHLNAASLILLLISADFMASDYCYGIEMKQAMERHMAGDAVVIPILLRPVAYERAPFANLRVLPTSAQPITTWSNPDAAFLDVARGISEVIEILNGSKVLSSESTAEELFISPSYAHLHAQTTDSILICYSHRDREAARQLYANLQSLDFKLWRDLHDIRGSEPFWEEVKQAIDTSESIVLCMSSDALKSEFVQKEWHYACQRGKRVVPVVVADVDFNTVPRWMSRVDWKDFRAGVPECDTAWVNFIRTLNTPYEKRKVPFMVDPLPPYFVKRPDELENVVNVMVGANDPVSITASVKGAGGFGKTILAAAICHDSRIRCAFDEGILWVTLGEKPSEIAIIDKTLDLVEEITGDRPQVKSKEAAKAELTKAIGDRYILLVIDDLWRKADADIFLTGGQNYAVLITTRNDHMLPDETRFKQNVDAMQLAQAVNLLTWNIHGVGNAHQSALESLATRLGKWAVILRLTNGLLRKRIDLGDTLGDALAYADEALTRKGLRAFDSNNPQKRSEAVHSTLCASLELLSDVQCMHFARIAVFPEDVDVPFTTLERLWGLDNFDTEDAAGVLNDAALLLHFDLGQRCIRLHDVIRRYLIDEYRMHLVAWQAEFVGTLGNLHALPDTYTWRHIAYHLYESGKLDNLRDLLLDYTFLQAKLNATDANALISDCDYLPDDAILCLLRSILRMSIHILAVDKGQLRHQLFGRLARHNTLGEYQLLEKLPKDGLSLLRPSLELADGPLILTLVGHRRGVKSVVVRSGSRVVSGSSDGTLRVWNIDTASTLDILEGHMGEVIALAVLPSGHVVSGSKDGTLRVWDVNTRETLHILKGHAGEINALVVLPDNRIISGSDDGTLRVWDASTGETLRILEGYRGHACDDMGTLVVLPNEHLICASGRIWNLDTWNTRTLKLEDDRSGIYAAAVLPNSRLVYGSGAGILRTCDIDTGETLWAVDGEDCVTAIAVLSDGSIVSGSYYGTLRVCDLNTGQIKHILQGHTGRVNAIAVLPNNCIVSSSDDCTLKVWNMDNMLTVQGHSRGVTALAMLLDGRIISGSSDDTLRVWDIDSGQIQKVLKVHTNDEDTGRGRQKYPDDVTAIAVLSDGRVVSGSSDGILRVWDIDSGQMTHILWPPDLPGHREVAHVTAVAELPDGRIVSGFGESLIIQVWDINTGQALYALHGHRQPVIALTALSNGRIVSGSIDCTLRVWDVDTKQTLQILEGHSGPLNGVRDVAELPDGCIVSGSDDQTLRVWNLDTAETLRILHGHKDRVNAVAILSVGRVVSGSEDHTLRIWNTSSGECLAMFVGESSIRCCTTTPSGIIIVGERSGRMHVLRWVE